MNVFSDHARSVSKETRRIERCCFLLNCNRWWFAAIVFGLIRFAIVVVDYPSLEADPDAYRAIAEGWSSTGTMGRLLNEGMVSATAYRPPVYPWLLSWVVINGKLWLPAVACFHVLLGVLTCLLASDLSSRLSPRRELQEAGKRSTSNVRKNAKAHDPRDQLIGISRHGEEPELVSSSGLATLRAATSYWLVGLGVALDPILLRQSCLIMTETVATFLTVLIWWIWVTGVRNTSCFQIKQAFIVGLMLGVNCLIRPTMLVWSLLWIVALLIYYFKYCHRSTNSEIRDSFSRSSILAIVLGIAIILTPWAIRNRVVLGSTIWTTTHGGYTLLLANNPILFRHLELEGFSREWDEERFHSLWSMRSEADPRSIGFWNGTASMARSIPTPSSEGIDDQLANETAWATIASSPSTFFKASVARILWLWALSPSHGQVSKSISILIGVWYATLFMLVAYGIWRGFIRWISKSSSPKSMLLWIPVISLFVGLTGIHAVYWSNMRMRAPMMPMMLVIAATATSCCRKDATQC